VLFKDTLEPGTWELLQQFAPGAERTESVLDGLGPSATRFYRLLVP
jgi:hypothetical protein